MPFKSQAQSRAFHAAENDPEVAKKLGISQETAHKFIADTKGQKISSLPEHVPHKARGGPFTMPPKKFEW